MNHSIANNWKTDLDQFASRIELDDIQAFFSKQLLVEPGTRALIVDSGEYLGDVGPGSYVMQSFAERLAFWRRKQATAILTRQEDFPVELHCTDIPTVENLTVDAVVRMALQIEDVALFLRNLMGSRSELRAADLREILAPIVWQALWEAIGSMSIKCLSGPEGRADIEALIENSLSLSLRRYGLRFVSVQLAAVEQEKYDDLRRKHGEAWLEKEDLQVQAAQNELSALADKLGLERQQNELTAEQARIEVRNDLRAAMRSEAFDKLEDEEAFAKFLHERDQANLLREDELNQLVAGFSDKKQDRELARAHLLSKLDLQRQMDLERIREQLDHAAKATRLQHELELCRRTASLENAEWEHQVQLEQRVAEQRRAERQRELEHQQLMARQQADRLQEAQWSELLHRQKSDRIQTELALSQVDRQARIAKIEQELSSALAAAELETERRRGEWEREQRRHSTDDQLDKLRRTQEVNAEIARQQMDLHERRRRLDVELDELRADKAGARDLARLQATKHMPTEALIVNADQANAALLADLKKHEFTQQAVKAQADAAMQHQANEQRANLVETLALERQQAANDMAAMYKQVLGAQQNAQEKTLNALCNVAQSASDKQPPVVISPVVSTPHAVPHADCCGSNFAKQVAKVIVCSGCSTENEPQDHHCRNCGEKLFP